MLLPRFLKAGDRVGIVAAGRRIDQDSIDFACKTFQRWELVPVVSPYIFSDKHSYLSGTDEERRTAFQQMIDDPTLSAIVCARGGYGTTRIIDSLNFEKFLQQPKWIVGFSDITALHLQLAKFNVASIHGIMPVLFDRKESDSSVESLRAILFGSTWMISAKSHPDNKQGVCTGRLIGGNLSLLVDSIGTAHDPDYQDKILVIEEIDEYLYKIDRMLVQLKRAGKLARLAGLCIGYFTDTRDSDLPFGENFSEIIQYHTRDYNYPVGFNFPTGHELPNLAWIQGVNATLEVTADNSTIQYKPEVM